MATEYRACVTGNHLYCTADDCKAIKNHPEPCENEQCHKNFKPQNLEFKDCEPCLAVQAQLEKEQSAEINKVFRSLVQQMEAPPVLALVKKGAA